MVIEQAYFTLLKTFTGAIGVPEAFLGEVVLSHPYFIYLFLIHTTMDQVELDGTFGWNCMELLDSKLNDI